MAGCSAGCGLLGKLMALKVYGRRSADSATAVTEAIAALVLTAVKAVAKLALRPGCTLAGSC